MKGLKLTTAAFALASSLVAVSCADQQESLIVVGAPSWPGTCVVQVPSQTFLAGGRLDARFETEYLVPLELQNQLLQQSGNAQNSGTDNSELQIVGADVVIRSEQRPDLIDELRVENASLVEFSPAVPTNSIVGGGTLGFVVPGIPAATTARIAELRVEDAISAGLSAMTAFEAGSPDATDGQIDAARIAAESAVLNRYETFIVNITIRARRTGNSVGRGELGEIEAREFEFPVEICHGCQISCGSCEQAIDNDGDGMVDEMIVGVCPPTQVPREPTERVFLGNFVGAGLGCPSAQDDFFIPSQCM